MSPECLKRNHARLAQKCPGKTLSFEYPTPTNPDLALAVSLQGLLLHLRLACHVTIQLNMLSRYRMTSESLYFPGRMNPHELHEQGFYSFHRYQIAKPPP